MKQVWFCIGIVVLCALVIVPLAIVSDPHP